MLELFIVRHGQCESNVPDLIQGQTDSPLTPAGVRQAEAVARRLEREKLAAVYSSDLSRARDTAKAVAARHGLSVIETCLLRECCLGVAQGLTVSQFRQRYPDHYARWQTDPIVNRPPGAERFEDVIARCGRFLSEIGDAKTEDCILAVVGHIGSISGLICAALDLPMRAYLSIHVDNASLSILELGDRSALRLLNDTCHLR